jgi:hypothetical protein
MEASMAGASVSLPGGSGSFTTFNIGSDAKKAVTAAIKQLFNAAGQNITANEIASGVDGDKGFFNVVLDGALKATTITAGNNVQALIDTGLGHDTLVGNASTTLFVGNSQGDSFSSMATASTIVGGAGNDTVAITGGSATAYLEGGNNLVNVSGGAVTLSGTGGTDTVNVAGGANTVSAAYKATIDIIAGGTDTISLAKGSQVNISGNNVNAVITGSNETITITGSNEYINLIGKNDTIIVSGGSNDTITYSDGTAGKHRGSDDSATTAGGAAEGHHGRGEDTLGGMGATLAGGEKTDFLHHNNRHSGVPVKLIGDTKISGGVFSFDAKAHGSSQTVSFSSIQGPIATAHALSMQRIAALKGATTLAGGAHSGTTFTVNHDKITTSMTPHIKTEH